MSDSSEIDAEQDEITRRRMQEVIVHDSVNLVDCGEDELISAPRGNGTGRMILDFSSGDLEVTVTSTDAI